MFVTIFCILFRFFKQVLLLICVHQMSSGLFRFIGSVGRNIIIANTFGSFGLLTIFVLGGFILARGKVYIRQTSCCYCSKQKYYAINH